MDGKSIYESLNGRLELTHIHSGTRYRKEKVWGHTGERGLEERGQTR